MELTLNDIGTQMEQSNFETIECPLNQNLFPEVKMYTREIFIPAGTMALGMIHKQGAVNILTKGHILVKTSMDDPGVELIVPENETLTFSTAPGSQKMVYAIEDTIFINIFNSESTNLEDVPSELVQQKQIGGN